MSVHIHLFGGFSLEGEQGALPAIASRAGRSLFAYLVIHCDRPHTRELLAGLFWPDLPEARARRRLSQALWQIRQALAPLASPVPYLLADAETVQFDDELPYWLDVQTFEQNLKQASVGPSLPPAEQISRLDEAVALYNGDFLAGYYDDWVLMEQERLRDLFLEALDRLVLLYKSQGLYEAALSHAARLTREDPLWEEAHREVMRLCFLLGRPHEAIQQYQRCRALFAAEFDTEPGPTTTQLHDEIQGYLAAEGIIPLQSQPPALVDTGAPLFADAKAIPFVGRKQERAALVRVVEEALGGQGGIVLVEGEPGVGKTRLLQEAARDAAWRGCQVLWGLGREHGELTPYGPLRELLAEALTPLRARQLAEMVDGLWLREVSQIVPQLAEWLPDLPLRDPPKPEQAQNRMLEAISQVLLALEQIAPHLLILDDVHWADGSTLDLLVQLAPRLRERRLLIVLGYRGEEAHTRPELWNVLRVLDQASGRARLSLARLSQSETADLVRRGLRLLDHAPRFETRLHRESDGNPLFVLETLRTLHDAGLLYRDEASTWHTPWDETTDDYAELPIPPQLKRIISRRLARLGPASGAILAAAAVLGDGFDLALLHQTSGREMPEILDAMRDLLRRGLLVEQQSAYQFGHDRIRQVAYEETATATRQDLHRRAGQTLETLQPERASALAFHFAEGQVWDKAAHYHQEAGDRARVVYANAEATAHYTQALAALERLPGPADPARAYSLRLARERVHALRGARAAQAEDLAALETLAGQLNDDRCRLEVTLRQSRFAQATGDYAIAGRAAQVAIALAKDLQDASGEATAHLYWGQALYRQGDYSAARARLERALELACSAPSQLAALAASSWLGLGNILADRGDKREAMDHYRRARDILQEIGDRRGAALPLNSLALLSRSLGDPTAASTYWQQALQIAREVGDRYAESLALGNLSGVAMDLGDYVQAQNHLQQALGISRDIANRLTEGGWLYALGLVARGRGEPAQARLYAEQALHILQGAGVRRHEAWALFVLGSSAHQLGLYPQAKREYAQSLHISQEIGDTENESQVLAYLGLLAHHQGDNRAARDLCQQALQIMQATEEHYTQGHALTNLGHALAGLGHLEEASQAYRQALDKRQALGQVNLAAESQAGLARVALARGDPAQALGHVESILRQLETGKLDGADEPLRIYLTCHQVLAVNEDPRAASTLSTAHRLLQEWAARIADEALRCSFLEDVAAHREIVAAWLEVCSQPATVRLPRAEAPTGRPLRDDEWVDVAWTVSTPEDARIAGKVARRQHRLLRLLGQAAGQGAAPTVDDLAGALESSPATIKRDLAALRAQGREVVTRGSRGP